GLVPAERRGVVAHELLVERGLAPAGFIVVGGPEARGVRCEDLVGEHELSSVVDSELELRVGDEDPARCRVLSRETVELDRRLLDLGQPLFADQLRRLLVRQRLVVPAGPLRRRAEDRLSDPVGFDPPVGSTTSKTEIRSLATSKSRSSSSANSPRIFPVPTWTASGMNGVLLSVERTQALEDGLDVLGVRRQVEDLVEIDAAGELAVGAD